MRALPVTILLFGMLVSAWALAEAPPTLPPPAAPVPKAVAPPPDAGLSAADAAEIGLTSEAEADKMAARKVEQIRKHLAEIVAKYDTNRDGTLSTEEISKMDETPTSALPPGAATPKKNKMKNDPLLKYDLDHNFRLDDIEAAAARDAAKAEVLAKNARIIKRFDTNGDGVIDATELAAAKAALQKEREERSKPGAKGKAKTAAPLVPASPPPPNT